MVGGGTGSGIWRQRNKHRIWCQHRHRIAVGEDKNTDHPKIMEQTRTPGCTCHVCRGQHLVRPGLPLSGAVDDVPLPAGSIPVSLVLTLSGVFQEKYLGTSTIVRGVFEGRKFSL